MGFSVKIQRSLDGSAKATTAWNLDSGSIIPLVNEEDSQNIYILAGCIYGRARTPLRALATEFTEPEAALDCDGRFVFAVYNKAAGTIRAWTDKYRLLGAFVVCGSDGITFANDYWRDNISFDSDKIDMGSVMDLLMFGYVQPPRTLYTNAFLLAGYTEVDANGRVTQRDWRQHWPVASAQGGKNAAADLYQILRTSASDIVRWWKPSVFRMSGGVDTRLIAGALSRTELEQLDFQVVCAPYLNEAEDRDVLGAKILAAALDVPLKVLHMEPAHSAFFADLGNGPRVLSGLYGGEFLGGVMFSEETVGIAAEPGRALNVERELLAKPQLAKESRERFAEAVAQYGPRRFLTSIFLGTFRSTIYQSVLYSWSNPCGLGQLVLSPFSERRFLDRMLTVPDEQLANYNLYGEIVRRHMPETLRRLPMSSPITRFNSDLVPFSEGRDPKFRPSISETPLPASLAPLKSAFEKHGVRWAQEPADPALLLRLYNLQNGLTCMGAL